MTDADRLDAIAATQLIVDAEVGHCWTLLRQGIQTRKLGADDLQPLIAYLRAGKGMSLDELFIGIEPLGSDRAVVRVLDDQRFCAAPELIAELERLAQRASSKTSSAPSSLPPDSTPPAGASSESHASGEPDVLDVMAALLGTTPARLIGDPDAYRAHVERVRAATAALAAAAADPSNDDSRRAAAAAQLAQVLAASAQAGGATAKARTADLAGTMAALGVDVDRLAAALRTVTEWLEARTPAAGAAVDRMVAALEEAAGPLLGEVDRATLDAERDTRLRNEARDAIAARLAKALGST